MARAAWRRRILPELGSLASIIVQFRTSGRQSAELESHEASVPTNA